jgi:hypothetical protein
MSQRHDMDDRIAAEAWKNLQFKKELLENLRVALAKHLKMNIPDHVEIRLLKKRQSTFISFCLQTLPKPEAS